MIISIVVTCFLGVLLAAGFVIKQHRQQTTPSRRENSQLEEVLRTAQLTNGSFFRPWNWYKNLESLLGAAQKHPDSTCAV